MRDIIITGAQGSGKSGFAQKYFSKDYTIIEDAELSSEEFKKLVTQVNRPGKPCVFISQKPVDVQPGRRFIVINMPV